MYVYIKTIICRFIAFLNKQFQKNKHFFLPDTYKYLLSHLNHLVSTFVKMILTDVLLLLVE